MFHKIEIAHNVWIPEPRWSWYNTPIWRTTASIVTITITFNPVYSGINTGSLVNTNNSSDLFKQYVYLTDEEFVMFKLEDNIQEGIYNMAQLQQGTIYN